MNLGRRRLTFASLEIAHDAAKYRVLHNQAISRMLFLLSLSPSMPMNPAEDGWDGYLLQLKFTGSIWCAVGLHSDFKVNHPGSQPWATGLGHFL